MRGEEREWQEGREAGEGVGVICNGGALKGEAHYISSEIQVNLGVAVYLSLGLASEAEPGLIELPLGRQGSI